MKFLSVAEICEVFERLKRQNPSPSSELKWTNPYTMLVSTVLSAQATDKSVNKATESLYKIADTPEKMLALAKKYFPLGESFIIKDLNGKDRMMFIINR